MTVSDVLPLVSSIVGVVSWEGATEITSVAILLSVCVCNVGEILTL